MREIKFTFYEMEIEETLFKCDIENFLCSKNIKENFCQIGEYLGLLEKYNQNIFIFKKFRKDILPLIGDTKGEIREIELKQDEFIVEENIIYIDFQKNIVLFHKNSAGFTTNAFQQYMKQLLKQNFFLKPIYTDEHLEALENTPIIKKINFKLSNLDEIGLKMIGFDATKVKDYIELEGTESIEITITSKRKHKIGIFSTLQQYFNFNIFDKLKIKASETYEENGANFDLLDNILTITKKIKTDNKRVKIIDIISEIENIYKEYEPKIRTAKWNTST
jgi:hypothetical protein